MVRVAAGALVFSGTLVDVQAGPLGVRLADRAASAQQPDRDEHSREEPPRDPTADPAAKPADAKSGETQPSPGKASEPPKSAEEVEKQKLLDKLRQEAAKQGVKFTSPNDVNPAPAGGGGATNGQPTVKPQPGAQPAVPVNPVPKPTGNTVGPPVPGAAGAASADSAEIVVPEGYVRIEFTDAVQLPVLINWVRDTLGIQLVLSDGGLQGQTVTIPAPLVFPKTKLMKFLISLVETKDYTIVEDPDLNLFTVQPRSAVQPVIGPGEFTTTRVIRTPNIRPSSMQQLIANLLSVNRVGGVQGAQPTFLDDIGIIIMTDTPRVLDLVQTLIDEIVKERSALTFSRYPLEHVAASSARERVLELIGQATQRFGGAGAPGQPAQPQVVGVVSPSTLNLNERLTIDPASNALLFRGRADEQSLLSETLRLVDVPNALKQEFYPVGLATAEAVANAGAKEQLGGSTTFESTAGRGGGIGQGRTVAPQPGLPGLSQSNEIIGVGFVIYPESGGFMYRGTPAQHERVRALIAQLKDLSERDRVTIEFYKLKHGKAEDVATVIQNLLSNTASSGNRGGLLGRDLGGANRQRVNQLNRRDPQAAAAANINQTGAEAGLGDLEGEDVFVISDDQNNQVVVKARAKLQPQFKQLIDRIDLRRPQVYLDAKIVVVTSTNALDLTVEAQQIIGQFAFNTNFGIGSLTSGSGDATTGGLTSRKNPATSLTGVTAALIRSRDVPLLINALARDVDGRTVATPQLLVDDNSEAVIESIEQRPTSTTQVQTGQPNVTSFGGFEDAGPKLTVTPQIADGGYLRLDYEVELSSFVGEGSANLPPPRQRNRVQSESVTVPTDHTIVVGGLTQESTSKTILKIPLLGDIPLLGNLFRDQNFTKNVTTLYVFITPKIMRDPTFADLRLITSKPLIDLDMPSELPTPEPARINIIDSADAQDAKREAEREKENKRRDTLEPRKKIFPFE